MNWIQLKSLIAEPGVIYRVFDCEQCNGTLRYHKVVRLQISKTDDGWLVFFSRKCCGLPTTNVGKLPRAVRNCGLETREWLTASQWNALVKVDIYAV